MRSSDLIQLRNHVGLLERLAMSYTNLTGGFVRIEYTDVKTKSWGDVTVKLYMNPLNEDEHYPFNDELQASLVLMDKIQEFMTETRKSVKEWMLEDDDPPTSCREGSMFVD